MPANKKYLTNSPVQKIAKITAAILGGYIVTEAFFMALIAWMSPGDVIFTLRYAGFILWAVLMIFAFIAKKVSTGIDSVLLKVTISPLLLPLKKLEAPIPTKLRAIKPSNILTKILSALFRNLINIKIITYFLFI